MDEKKYIDQINSLSEDEVRLKARLRTMNIQCALEKKAKRIKPYKFIPYIIDLFNNPPKNIFIAPHTILQAIETNCAYQKREYDEDITFEKFADIINLNKSLEDENDFYLWSIHHRIDLFFQFIARIQFEAQNTGFNKQYLSRYWKLFFDNNFTPKLFDKFSEKFGISVEKWFLCSIGMFSFFHKSLIGNSNIKIPPEINVNDNDISRYLDLSVYSEEEIKRNYFDARKGIPYEFHFLIRSIFMERPILKLNAGQIVAPIPKLIFRHMGYKLKAMFEAIDTNEHCLADSFEKYTEMVLNNLSSLIKLYPNNELETLSNPDKSCDFLLITPTENILIECKAVDFKVKTLTKNAIYNCNAFSKIQKAIVQIDSTLRNIKTKKIEIKELDKTKPFLKIVVTFGEMRGFNSDWLLNELLSKERLDIKSSSGDLNTTNPVIISIEGLEKLIMYIESSDKSLIDIYNAKQEQGYCLTGDWDAFLTNKAGELDGNENLNFVERVFNEIYERLGIKE